MASLPSEIGQMTSLTLLILGEFQKLSCEALKPQWCTYLNAHDHAGLMLGWNNSFRNSCEALK